LDILKKNKGINTTVFGVSIARSNTEKWLIKYDFMVIIIERTLHNFTQSVVPFELKNDKI
jgi:hypothetical protein